MRSFFFFGLMGLLILAFLYLIRPFFYSIFWAGIIAVMFHPLYAAVYRRLKIASVSSFVSVLLVVVVLFLPLIVFGIILIQQTLDLYVSFSSGQSIISNVNGFTRWLEGTSFAPYLENVRSQWEMYATNAVQSMSGFLFEYLKLLTQNSLRLIVSILIMLYALYYFFKDGTRFLNYLMYLSPLGNGYEQLLFNKFRSTTAATLKSTLVIGGVQGILGSLLFWFTGVPGAFFWGVVTLVFSLFPGFGSFIVWAPIGTTMLLLGNVWQGITILAFGTFVISTIDNLLRPPLVGKGTEMHPLIVFLSTIGGIIMFGISGFVIGPILAALFLSVVSMYDHYYKHELQGN